MSYMGKSWKTKSLEKEPCYLIFHTHKVAIDIIRSKIKKESWQLVKKQKSYSKSKNVQRMSKKLKISSLKLHKGAGIKKKNTKTFLYKGTKHKKNYT